MKSNLQETVRKAIGEQWYTFGMVADVLVDLKLVFDCDRSRTRERLRDFAKKGRLVFSLEKEANIPSNLSHGRGCPPQCTLPVLTKVGIRVSNIELLLGGLHYAFSVQGFNSAASALGYPPIPSAVQYHSSEA